MTKPWVGRGLWVWYEAQVGTVPDIIALSKQYGASFVLIKEADAGNVWWQTDPSELEQYKNASLQILAWTYAYGADPAAEAQAVIDVARMGFHGVVIDAEAELRDAEGANRSRTEIIDGIMGPVREALGWDYPIAVAPLPIVAYHSDLNYARWGEWGCDWMPQNYFCVFGPPYDDIDALIAQWPYDPARTAPVIGAYGDTGYSGDSGATYPSPGEIADAEAACVAAGYQGISYWRADTIKPDLWPFAEGEPYAGTPKDEDQVSEEAIAAIQQALINLVAIAGGQEAGGDPGAGAAIRAEVDAIIQAYPAFGLEA